MLRLPGMDSSMLLIVCKALLILLLPLSTKARIGLYGTKVANKCFSVAGVPRLDFDKCGVNEMILITDAIQGIGQEYQQCQYRHGDCIEPTTPETDNKLREQCIGQSSCSITVSVAWMPHCSAYSSYNYVMYRCIPKSEVINICAGGGGERDLSRAAFLRSPGFPLPYPPGLDCACNISTNNGQRILLQFADYAVEWSEDCENDVVEVVDGDVRMPRCGQLPRNYNITSTTSKLEVYFRSDNLHEYSGFWILAEALGQLKVSCGPVEPRKPQITIPTKKSTTAAKTTTMPPTTLPKLQKYKSTKQPSTENWLNNIITVEKNAGSFATKHEHQDKDINNNHNYYASENQASELQKEKKGFLAGIIIGTVLVLLVVIILIFIVVWFKRRRHKEDINPGMEPTYRPKSSMSE